MSGKWAGSNRRDTLPIDWATTRKRIFRRDGGRCTDTTDGTRCGARASHCDHVVPHYLGGTDDDDNLTSLCPHHHGVKSAREGNQARNAVYAKAKRPPVRHPGFY